MSENKPKTHSKSKTHSFSFNLFRVMLIVTALQLATFLIVLIFGGEFKDIKKYAYDSFIEKNTNRKSYVEQILNSKTAMVYEAASSVNATVDELLTEKSLSASDISSDKELNRSIISETSDILINLLRQNEVNDAYIILDSGSLYSSEDAVRKSGFYIRDIDPTQNSISNNNDLLTEIGNSEISAELDIVLDFEWSSHLNITDNAEGHFDFYYNTLNAAREFPNRPITDLGYWSSFSKISRSASESLKFTVPLISDDGTVYGIIGIGLTEKYILEKLPIYDSLERSACYILGSDKNGVDEYSIEIHSGAMFARLVNEHTKLNKNHLVEGDIYNFNSEGSIDSVGNIQQINLYGSSSVFNKQKWALIVIGERTKILNLYLNFISMFTVSSVISVIITVIGSLLLNRTMTTPVTQMIHRLNSTENKNDIIEFSPTKIAEIDTLGQAIVHLQINVKESASRVSKFMSMVDMGIGVFMYDILDGSVFLSESIIKLLNLPLEPADTTISVDECVKYLNELDPEDKVISNSIFSAHDENKQIKTDIEVICKQIGKRKNVNLKFSLTRENNYIIGLVQDITAAVAEKRRIEFERDYDITTGLLNRRAFYSRLDDIFKTPEVLKTAAVLMIDLDNLKYVNDTYGHDFGDDYIKTAAHIFNDFSDYGGIVARLSGDEFCIFLYGLNSMDDARSIISKIQNKMMESYCILADGTHYKIRASGGISWYPRDAVTYDTLIKYADFAMYTIKHTTKGSIAEFDKDIYNRDSILLTGIEEMNRIIETESIQFAFQSILDARTGQIYGYEILMRPISDLLRAPLEFIRIATAGSKLGEIERLTWLKGLRSFKEKMNDGLISKDCKLFINSLANCELSPQDIELIEDNYSDVLSNIVLELLESEKDNAVFTKNKKQTLKNWNAKFALDDYGSGYNSETVFIKTNPDIIKITRSIISRCDNNEDKKSILKEMVSMAKQMNTIVLAEGVETAEEMRTVIECGVDLIQGYYTNHPSFDIQPVNDEIVQQIKDFYEASQKSKT